MSDRFRLCRLEDLETLRSFSEYMYYETFKGMCSPEDMDAYLREAFAAEKLRGELSDPASSFYFLYCDDALAGYIKLNEAPAQTDLHDPDSLELERIYVSLEKQGNGLGAVLLKEAEKLALQAGKKYLWLGVWEKNERALHFYRKHGFYETGTHSFVMGDDVQTDYIMRKDLQFSARHEGKKAKTMAISGFL